MHASAPQTILDDLFYVSGEIPRVTTFETGLTACSHAGIVNVLTHARECLPAAPLHGMLGGFHLAGTNERIIPQTVEAMKPVGLKSIGAAHCTGWRAVNALAAAFGDAVAPSAVGKTYRYDG